jgi:uncharacterized DUF497 family protein
MKNSGIKTHSSLKNIDKVNTLVRIYHMEQFFELNGDLFVWDLAKAETNWRKHGVRFEEAETVFGDPLFILVDASRNEETRDAAIGFDIAGRLLYVVHIEFDESYIRIISARRAEADEVQRYDY